MTWFIWLAIEPYEALPLGNGQLGVLMRNQGGITWLFNHGSFFANAAQDNDLISSGEFSLQRPDDWRAGFVEERLVLHDAMLVTRYKTGADLHTVKSWLAVLAYRPRAIEGFSNLLADNLDPGKLQVVFALRNLIWLVKKPAFLALWTKTVSDCGSRNGFSCAGLLICKLLVISI